MDKKTTGIVSYLTWVGWIVAFAAGDREGAKFHLNQSLALWLGALVWGAFLAMVGTVLGWIPILGKLAGILLGVIGGVSGFVFILLIVLGVIAAARDEERALPVFGSIHILK